MTRRLLTGLLACSITSPAAAQIDPAARGLALSRQAPLSPAQKLLILPQRVQVRQVMASPPTVTWASSCASITSPRFVPAVASASAALNPLFRYRRGGAPVQAGPAYPRYAEVKLTSVNYGTATQSNVVGVPVLTDGAGVGICFGLANSSGPVTFKIDGQYVSLTGHSGANTGDIEYGFVPLTDGNLHEVEVIGGAIVLFSGVSVPTTATLLPATARGPLVVFLGDSGEEGTGATGPWNSMVVQFADALGWDDVRASAVGSTGMLNPGTTGKVNWLGRVATDVCPFAPDLVMLPASINDSGYTAAQVSAQAGAIVAAIRACAPRAQIVMASAWTPKGGGFLPAIYYQQNAALRSLAASLGLAFVDALEAPLPPGVAAQTTTLTTAITSPAQGATIYTATQLVIGGTYTFADGQHFVANDSNPSGSVYASHVDLLQQAEALGATMTLVGPSTVSGNGRVGGAQGNGSADRVTGSDATHPTDYGHQVDGTAWAIGLLNVVKAGR